MQVFRVNTVDNFTGGAAYDKLEFQFTRHIISFAVSLAKRYVWSAQKAKEVSLALFHPKIAWYSIFDRYQDLKLFLHQR